MRIVAGELKGRRLASPPRGSAVRPTPDKVREALFSILRDVSGMRVLDLFCGTGALGIEAISRGAAHATFVDDDTAAVQRNVDTLGIGDRATLTRADALAFLRDERGRFDPGPFELILCDPPYKLAARLGPDLKQLLPARLAPGGRIVTESASRRPLDLGLELERERVYGDTSLRLWRVE